MGKKFLIGCGGLLTVGMVLIVLGGVWLMTGPEGGVRTKSDMEAYAIEYLAEHEILTDSEELIAYYDVTMSCDGSEAAILTNERVIYHKNGLNDSMYLVDVDDIQYRKESFAGDIFEIYSTDGKLMKVEIALMNQGETFGNALRRAVAVKQKAESQ